MAEQLRLRNAGLGPSTDRAAIMMRIAQQLSDSDIGDVANYFETLPAEPSTHSPHLGGAISRVPLGVPLLQWVPLPLASRLVHSSQQCLRGIEFR